MYQLQHKETKRGQQKYLTVRYNAITVFYTHELDGGGRGFGQDYIPVVSELFGKVDTICEFASGPGFIGFSLLANGLCNKLCLVDINPKAIEACRKTIKDNHLEKVVTAYVSDSLDNVPTKEKWDLVVSNPPHFDQCLTGSGYDLLLIDPKWVTHKNFYQRIKRHLQQGGSVLFQENSQGSTPNIFKDMIAQGGLTYIRDFKNKRSSLKTLAENILFILVRLHPGTLIKAVRVQLKGKVSQVVNICDYPLYFVWSKKI